MKYYTTMPSPLGPVTIQANDEGILGIWFETHTTRPDELGTEERQHLILSAATAQLEEYFAGKRTCFDLPLVFDGTPFQVQVWQGLTKIPYGEVCSYKALAQAIGRPNAVRAVGAANGRNPISVVVPCHRVIGASGQLTGYAGGTERKAALLALERDE